MSILRNRRQLAVPFAIVLLLVCAAGLGASVLVPTGIAAATAPSLVSASCDGGPANGNSQQAAVSADGQFVAFYSDGTNLAPGDTNGQHDAFIRDRASGAVELLNVSSDGQIGNNESAYPRPSGDGRYVTFHSLASNLVPGDTNDRADIFVRDRQLGTTERVSVATDGSEANAHSGGQVITPDGRYIVYVTGASNLSPLDTQADNLDIYLRDRQTGDTELVSLAEDGTRPYIFESLNPSVSDDGRYIAFESRAQLVADDTNYDSDVYVRDRLTGTTVRISTPPGGGNADSYSYIRLGHGISGDGRYIAFESGSTDLVAGDTNGWADVFIHDQTTGTTTLLSVAADGSQGNSVSATAAISGDGSRVAFFSVASNLIPGDTNGIQDVFVRDWPSGGLELVNVTEGGGQFSVNTAAPSLSRDGSVIAYIAAPGTPYGGSDGFTDILVNAAVNCAPTATTPGSPTSVTAGAGDGQASVSWAAPASDGGSPITSYTVTSSPDGLIATTAGATSATVTGLSNGTGYTFTVSAANVVGSGPSSDPSVDPVTPQAGAAAPQTTTETVPPGDIGTATTDPTATGPTPSDPVTTSVTVPPTSDGGTISIAETAVTQSAPAGGYQFFGQQIDITSTAGTTASNPLTIVFTIDSSAIRTSLGLAPSDPLPTADQVTVTKAETGSPIVLVVATCTTSTPPIDPDPCVSERQYINNGDDLRITILTGSASHWNTAVKPVAVTVADNGYSPKSVTVAQGGSVLWTFAGSKPHSVTENLKLGPAKSPLFNSGALTSGRYGYLIRAAATYTYGSTVKGDPGSFAGTVAVPVGISPTSGGTATSFTVTWSSAAMTGYVFDVQYRFMKAGSKTWSPLKSWKASVATTSATFSPSSGKGTYAFSARLRNSSTGLNALWSPEATLIVR